jgi:hypothetical protein
MDGWENTWSKNGGLQPGQEFDASEPLPFINTLFEKNLVPTGIGFIPGCGRGYAVGAFSRGGRSILGIEISRTAVEAARKYLTENPPCENSAWTTWSVEYASFFDYTSEAKFDFAYDYTFLCAIDPNQRKAWAEKYSHILKPKGQLLTALFPIGDYVPSGVGPPGPPYPLSVNLVEELLKPYGFRKIFEKDLGSGEAHSGREGKTTFCIWSR